MTITERVRTGEWGSVNTEIIINPSTIANIAIGAFLASFLVMLVIYAGKKLLKS